MKKTEEKVRRLASDHFFYDCSTIKMKEGLELIVIETMLKEQSVACLLTNELRYFYKQKH